MAIAGRKTTSGTQAVDVREQPLGEPIKIELAELVFHHDEDEELH